MPEYAIAGTWAEFYEWKKAHPEADVRYLTKERAKQFIERGAEKGILHRIGSWETSAALEDALRLERDESAERDGELHADLSHSRIAER